MSVIPLIDRQSLKRVIIRTLMFFALGAVLLWGSPQPTAGQQPETVTYTYDNLNRLTSATYSSGPSIIYTYDAAGNRTSTQVVGGSTTPSFGIDSVTPKVGRAAGGQQITLSGAFAGLATITMGGVAASWSYTNGTNEVSVITPPHSVGAVSIDLIPTSGSTYSKSNAFAYLPTVFTDDTLVVNVTTAKAQHIIELRKAVDALRAVAGLSPAPWTNVNLIPTSSVIKTIDVLELRTYLDDAATRLSYLTSPYTDHTLGVGFSIRRVHIEELRQRIKAIAG